jgi:hypothetical protein
MLLLLLLLLLARASKNIVKSHTQVLPILGVEHFLGGEIYAAANHVTLAKGRAVVLPSR